MNARHTASLVLKLIGIFTLIKYLGYLPMVLSAFNLITSSGPSRLDTFVGIAISAGTPLLYLIVSILIIVKSDAIAERIAQDEQVMIASGIDADTIQTLAFCILGLVLLTGAVPKLAQLGTNYFMLRRMPNRGVSYTLYGQLIGTVLQIIIGFFLFLQADGLTGLWKKLREAKGIQNS
jgi:uncharacterized membrane protein